jgi:adenylosuccinate synthase
VSRLIAVIGANYGDEGKGLVTDAMCTDASIVVRHNGGAQAGHTVVTPEGLRHVFHHLGSGTLRGRPTFMSEHFICNPLLFRQELEELVAKGVPIPPLFADPLAHVTTPWDMMLNQAAEITRGTARHGSCGSGIGETEERSQSNSYDLCFEDLTSPRLPDMLRRIRDEWVPVRARELGILPDLMPFMSSDALLERYLEDVGVMRTHISPCTWEALPKDDLVFEGAQGIGLDQGHWHFPHVTRSNTGTTNVIEMLEDAHIGREMLRVVYVTRPYVTRHGAGPLERECAREEIGERVHDETNVPNTHQGTLRWAHFDMQHFESRIQFDLENNERERVEVWLALTCADQVDRVRVFEHNRESLMTPEELYTEILDGAHGFWNGIISHGPTRRDVE